MKKLYSFDKFINEGVRDMMTPKSKEDLRKHIDTLVPGEKLRKGMEFGVLSKAEARDMIDRLDPEFRLSYGLQYSLLSPREIHEVFITLPLFIKMRFMTISNYRYSSDKLIDEFKTLSTSEQERILNSGIINSFTTNTNYRGNNVEKFERILKRLRKVSSNKIAKSKRWGRNSVFEGVKDKMTPKTTEDIQNSMDNMTDEQKLNMMLGFIRSENLDMMLVMLNRGLKVTPYMKRTASQYHRMSARQLLDYVGDKQKMNESLRDKMTPRHMDDIRQSFKDKGYRFGWQLLSATYGCDVDGVELILDLMYDVYTTTDSDEIRETIANDYLNGLDSAVKDGSYDIVELYLSCDIPGLGMSHLRSVINSNYAGTAELVYDRLKDGMSKKERQDVEAKIENKRMNESIKDMMTPKNTEQINDAIFKRMNIYPELGYFNPFDWGFKFNEKTSAQMDVFVFDAPDGRNWTIVLWGRTAKYPLTIRENKGNPSETEFNTNNYGGIESFLRIEGYKKVRLNEGVKDKMTPKSREEIRELIKKKIGTDKDIISVRFNSPTGDEQWMRFRKQLKNELIKIEVLSSLYLKVTGDVIDVYEFYINYFGLGEYMALHFINREMINESVRDMMTPKSAKDIEISQRLLFDKTHIGWYEEYVKIKPIVDEAYQYIKSCGFRIIDEPMMYDYNFGKYGFKFENISSHEGNKLFILIYEFGPKKYMLSIYAYNKKNEFGIISYDEIVPWYNRETEKLSLISKLKSRMNELTKNDEHKIVIEGIKDKMTPKSYDDGYTEFLKKDRQEMSNSLYGECIELFAPNAPYDETPVITDEFCEFLKKEIGFDVWSTFRIDLKQYINFDMVLEDLTKEQLVKIFEFIFDKRLNEGVRDMMTPKSTDDIIMNLKDISVYKKRIMMSDFIGDGNLEMVSVMLDSGLKVTQDMIDRATNYPRLNVLPLLKSAREKQTKKK